MNTARFDFLLGETPRLLHQTLHVTLRGGENQFVALENRKAGIERLKDVPEVRRGRGDATIRRRRRFGHDAERWDPKLPKNGLETQAQIGFGVRKSTQPYT